MILSKCLNRSYRAAGLKDKFMHHIFYISCHRTSIIHVLCSCSLFVFSVHVASMFCQGQLVLKISLCIIYFIYHAIERQSFMFSVCVLCSCYIHVLSRAAGLKDKFMHHIFYISCHRTSIIHVLCSCSLFVFSVHVTSMFCQGHGGYCNRHSQVYC